ncbi:MAG: hypothetical protein C4K60_11635 [Ideonella sp. MAG2]|nr:MAG: hypothetical protein C4K60_11635 [Ideonella sp. MAG2]
MVWKGSRVQIYDGTIPQCRRSATEFGPPLHITAISANGTVAGSFACDQGTIARDEAFWVKRVGQAATIFALPDPEDWARYMPTGVSDAGSVVGLRTSLINQQVIGPFARGQLDSVTLAPRTFAHLGAGNGGLTALSSGLESRSNPPATVRHAAATWIDGERASEWQLANEGTSPFLDYRSAARSTWIAAIEMNTWPGAVVVQRRDTGEQTARFEPLQDGATFTVGKPVLSANGNWLSYVEHQRINPSVQTVFLVRLKDGQATGPALAIAYASGNVISISNSGQVLGRFVDSNSRSEKWYVRLATGTTLAVEDTVSGLTSISNGLMNPRGDMAFTGVYREKGSALRLSCGD